MTDVLKLGWHKEGLKSVSEKFTYIDPVSQKEIECIVLMYDLNGDKNGMRDVLIVGQFDDLKGFPLSRNYVNNLLGNCEVDKVNDLTFMQDWLLLFVGKRVKWVFSGRNPSLLSAYSLTEIVDKLKEEL